MERGLTWPAFGGGAFCSVALIFGRFVCGGFVCGGPWDARAAGSGPDERTRGWSAGRARPVVFFGAHLRGRAARRAQQNVRLGLGAAAARRALEPQRAQAERLGALAALLGQELGHVLER